MSTFNWWTKACTLFLLWAATAITLPAQTLTTLFSFDGTDGQYPYAGLVQGTDGEFYGTTAYGGSSGDLYAGTIFEIASGGTLKTLYNFCKNKTNCIARPFGALVLATDGNFYGTTYWGGPGRSACAAGCGTVFKMTPSGELTTLHNFDHTDGYAPYAALIQAGFQGISSEPRY